ncbi:prenyltransferase/squalene oxidase repeat-containing protein [Streptomyces sp. NPDC001985]|uniref:prenyltransferase/squalene oxidase repeat-containing protein n=1 Tax=Streptomyces sp. NPDC001985 TaxID=3154406 RepID=UPI00333113E1
MRPAHSGGLPQWPRTALPEGLTEATHRLRDRIRERTDPDGRVHDPCHSRVLESALLLSLLDRTRAEPAARARVAGYLTAHRASPVPLDRFLADAALGGRPGADRAFDMDGFLARVPDFTGARKQALLHTILLLLGAGSATAEPPPPAAYRLDGLQSWARVQVTAVKVIQAGARGRSVPIGPRDVELLRSTQRPGRVWQGNLLVHLCVLHALDRLPGHRETVAEGIRGALEHQRPDGGLPFIRDEDTWLTAVTGVALHTAGADRPLLDAVTRRLLRLQRSDGGWSYSEDAHLSDVDCTSAATEALHLADPVAHRAPIGRAIDFLLPLRGADGGFPTYGSGAPSEACMTAAAVNALSTQDHRQPTEVEAALAFLASQQHRDGSFPPDWSTSRHHTVFRAVLAAGRHPDHTSPGSPAHRVISRAVRLVAGSQNTDGGWGGTSGAASDALSTAYALVVLGSHGGTPGAAGRGAAYLLARQRSDGSIDGVPDSIGPRPFLFRVPALADAFALLALGHLAGRLAPAPPPPPARHPDGSGRRERNLTVHG